MILIGHRGAAGLAPENTIAALQAGMDAGADMLEFDIRLTKDGIPVVIHDASTRRTHEQNFRINRTTLHDLQAGTTDEPIPTLQEVLTQFFGKITLNIECKEPGSGVSALAAVEKHITKKADWQHVLFSSFHATELRAIREQSLHAPLALLQKHNAFAFVQQQAILQLTAVGFYKLTVNPLAIAIAKKRGITTYAYTVDQPATAKFLQREGIDAIVTNRPDRFTR